MRSARWLLLLALAQLALAACEDDDLGQLGDGGGAADAVQEDSGRLQPDAQPADQGPADAGVSDAGAEDQGVADVEAPDQGAPDAAAADQGVPDATSDAGESCDGGVNASSLNTTDSSHLFSGTGPASSLGQLVLTSTGGQSLTLPVPTDASGAWSVDVPLFCGQQTLEVSFPGLCSPVTQIMVTRGACGTPDLQITLSWDNLGLDFELHLIRPGGRINDNTTDCTWTSCIGTSPDWGVPGDPLDDPHKDVDNTSTFGPENIYLSGLEPGLYTVMVEHWGSGAPGADGEVTIILGGAPTATIAITDLASHWVRYVATVEWSTRAVTPLPTVHDCTLNWSGGCRDLIP